MANTKVTSAVIADNAVGIDQLNVSDGTNGQVLTTNGSGTLSFADAGGGVDGIVSSADATAITIDSSENVGIGVTPSSSTFKNLQINTTGIIGSNTGYVWFGNNWVYNSGDKYIANGYATLYGSNEGKHTWFVAPSGTAGNAISFSQAMTIDNSGNVGIGTSSPSEALHVNSRAKIGNITLAGNSTDSTLSAGNANFKISTLQFTGGAGGLDFDIFLAITGGIQRVFQVEASGAGDTYTNDGTISSLSDERVKTDIQDLTDGLEIVKQLRPVTFKYNDTSTSEEGHKLMGGASDKVRYGFIAQEVEQVAPQYVEYSTRKINNEEVDDFRNLSTTRMLPMLFKAVQEQQTIIDDLKARIETLENA